MDPYGKSIENTSVRSIDEGYWIGTMTEKATRLKSREVGVSVSGHPCTKLTALPI
jgi:hypothetical protein